MQDNVAPMRSFTLPAGARLRFTATAEPASRHLHRWGVEFSGAAGAPNTIAGQQVYGSEIGRGEDQRIDVPEQAMDRLCQVWASHHTTRGWEPDVAHVTVDTPDDLAIAFRRASDPTGMDGVEECVMTFQFSPALRT